jgi:hypothetical protein
MLSSSQPNTIACMPSPPAVQRRRSILEEDCRRGHAQGGRLLYSDRLAELVKFTVPTLANGRVYVGTQTGLDVYGILHNIVYSPGGWANPLWWAQNGGDAPPTV